MRNRISEWLSARAGNQVRVERDGTLRFNLTERGYQHVRRYLAQELPRLNDAQPIQAMVKTPGWQIVEKELSGEILRLWTGALEKMASPKAEDREQAVWDCVIADVLNRRVLGRVIGRVVDSVMLGEMVNSFENASKDYNALTGANGNG